MKMFSIILVTLSLAYLTNANGSWQGYVDEQLVGTGHVKHAAIIGHDGGVWAVSSGFRMSEGKSVVNLFKQPQNVFATGVTVGSVKYMGIKGDERSIYGKKGACGIVLVKTGQTILIGIYDGTMQPGNAANVVEKLADYLIENGY